MARRPNSNFGVTAVQSTSPVMLAIEGIDQMIAKGKLVPGQRLAEEELSDELGLPRGRVREALRILAGQGVVSLTPYKGARVRNLPQGETIALHEIVTGLFSVGLVLVSFRYQSAPKESQAAFARISSQVTDGAKQATLRELIQIILKYHAFINDFAGNHHLVRLSAGLHLGHYYESILDHISEEEFRRCFYHAREISALIASGDTRNLLPLLWSAITPMLQSLHVSHLKARSEPPKTVKSRRPARAATNRIDLAKA